MVQASRSAPARRDAEQIRADIERARADVAASLLALRDGVGERLDWRNQVRRRPWAAVGIAFAIGFLLAGRRSSRQERVR